MAAEQSGTYEKLYYTMWEIGQRYGEFAPVSYTHLTLPTN